MCLSKGCWHLYLIIPSPKLYQRRRGTIMCKASFLICKIRKEKNTSHSITSTTMYNWKHVFLCFTVIFIVKPVHNLKELDNGFRKTETSLAANKHMNFGDIIFGLPQEQKLIIRRIEQTRKKLTKTKYSLAFNKTCLKENILPR